ncbi:MAG TPA: hypothetical protein VGM38_10600 [Pseudolysinimonas sp.]
MTGAENDDNPMKRTMFSGLRDIASLIGGGGNPQSIEDHPGMLPGEAKIVADEGQTMAENSATVALQRETYIVDLQPDNGTDPAIRAEVQCWVSWLGRPMVGDKVRAGYRPGTKEVVLLLAGDTRWDWKLVAANNQSNDAVQRDAILNAPPGSEVPKGPDSDRPGGGAIRV